MKQTEQQGVSFDKFTLEKARFEVNSDFAFPEGGVPVDFTVHVSKKIDKKNGRLKANLDISVVFKDVKEPPIDIFVSVAGYFSIQNSKNIEALEEFSEVNAPAFLFPFAREVIASLTLKSGYPPLLVPPTNIVALIGKSRKLPLKVDM